MNAEDRKKLEEIGSKIRNDGTWLTVEEAVWLKSHLEAAEARAEALEAECREERAQRQMAEDEVQRLREAIERHKTRSYGPSLIPTAGRDFDLYAALTPSESLGLSPEAEASVRRGGKEEA